ncbi:MAG TPA: response regulator [Burkholderiales bacterium]|nr:response regulator [Burkholderiales bacterium]
MSSRGIAGAKDDEIFTISEKGNRELKSAGTSLSAAELQVLVLVDGFSSVAEIARRVPSMSRADVGEALRNLVAAKLVLSVTEADAMASGFSTIAVPAGFFSSITADSSPEADGGTSILKKKGFYVRIARRPTDPRSAKDGWKPTILVVDDDLDLQKLIRTYFLMEGLNPRAALKRDDIIVALRKQPVPDLMLLDVQLPDANGFDILAKMRQHPVLRNMPVIMLTAEATREAVLKGLQGGADGYVTKPFEPDLLIGAVKAVLGL